MFFSFQNDITIYRIKISIKCDNNGLGKARISLKLLIGKKNITEIPKIFLSIQNISKKTKLEYIDENYNNKLKEKAFRNAAGTEKMEIQNIETFSLTEIDLIECPAIHNKRAILPDRVLVEEIGFIEDISQIPQMIFDEGIMLQITPMLNEAIKDEKIQKKIDTTIIEFQCRFFLHKFLSEDTLNSWKSSSEPWSTTLNIISKSTIGKKYETIEDYLIDPQHIDLWITIPHGHLFNASSPVYTSAIKLKKEDIEYKTYEGEKRDLKRYYKQFETQQGDYSVRIKNYNHQSENFGNFSIICTSPFLPEEKPGKLREDIEAFNDIKDRFVKWEDMISPLVLLLAVISILFSFPQYRENISNEITELIIIAIIFGLVVWSINIMVEQVTKRIGKRWKIDRISLLLIIILSTIIFLPIFF